MNDQITHSKVLDNSENHDTTISRRERERKRERGRKGQKENFESHKEKSTSESKVGE